MADGCAAGWLEAQLTPPEYMDGKHVHNHESLEAQEQETRQAR